MKIVLIAALAQDGTIGHKGRMPWHISEDLKRFKSITMGHPIIMGRKTFQSIGKPLSGRKNLVLTRDSSFQLPAGVKQFSSLQDALDECRAKGEPTAFIIGGADVYRQALPIADTLLLTHVHKDIMGDTKFPDYDHSQWIEVTREDGPEHTFVEYTRVQ